jgi:hypothetical protein
LRFSIKCSDASLNSNGTIRSLNPANTMRMARLPIFECSWVLDKSSLRSHRFEHQVLYVPNFSIINVLDFRWLMVTNASRGVPQSQYRNADLP